MQLAIYAVPTRAPSEEDEDVEGTYSAVVDDAVDSALAASVALDVFHDVVGVPEDFAFLVVDEDGKVLSEPDPEEQPDYQSDEHSAIAAIEKISDEVPADYRLPRGGA